MDEAGYRIVPANGIEDTALGLRSDKYEMEQLYRSPSGDVWFLARDPATGLGTVRHQANASSGGRVTDLEWKKVDGGKQPYAIGLKDGRLMALAGLWETWRAPSSGERVRSFAIVTTEPNQLCARLHNRMPVVLAPEAWPAWLGEEPPDEAQLKSLLVPYPSDGMICWPVSPRVGSVKNNDPSLVAN